MMAKEITPILNTEDRGGPAQPLLVVNNLKKYFPVRNVLFSNEKKFVHAVDNVSFTVAKGKTLGIVGESGCGNPPRPN
jgi:peptide/nickel transport system ATP-binding protein